jgi:photosystem II stability/assembly factor-like uncharacterized protein
MNAPPVAAANLVFQSADAGQHWQDISAGLPVDFVPSGIFATDGGLYLSGEQGVYRNGGASPEAAWKKEMALTGAYTTFSDGLGGVIAYNNLPFYPQLNNSGLWMPIFKDFKSQSIRLLFTAQDGSFFLCGERGIFKSADEGKTWNHTMQDGWALDMVEADGVLLCTSERGILRSIDGGENWEVAMNEGGVGIAVEVIEGGFAAIAYNSKSETRRVRSSTDGGRTWQAIDEGLPPSMLIASIKQAGGFLFCGHPNGIYRSADGGTSWQLLLPNTGEKVFDLSVSGEMLYAVLRNGGC